MHYKVPPAVMPTRYWRAVGMTVGGSGQVTRRIYSGWVGGKIPTDRKYCDEREDQYRLFLGLILFKLVVPSLQPGVVGPYLVRGTWFPSRLPLEGTDHIQIFWAVTGDLRYPGVQDPVSSPQVFC
jgi:hypothetical protein